MPLSAFFDTLGLILGFTSGYFFSVGAFNLTVEKVHQVSSTYWGMNPHWADSLLEQRTDYLIGGALLLLSFVLQLLPKLNLAMLQNYFEATLDSPHIWLGAISISCFITAYALRPCLTNSSKRKLRKRMESQKES
jgi:hypothetical protein